MVLRNVLICIVAFVPMLCACQAVQFATPRSADQNSQRVDRPAFASDAKPDDVRNAYFVGSQSRLNDRQPEAKVEDPIVLLAPIVNGLLSDSRTKVATDDAGGIQVEQNLFDQASIAQKSDDEKNADEKTVEQNLSQQQLSTSELLDQPFVETFVELEVVESVVAQAEFAEPGVAEPEFAPLPQDSANVEQDAVNDWDPTTTRMTVWLTPQTGRRDFRRAPTEQPPQAFTDSTTTLASALPQANPAPVDLTPQVAVEADEIQVDVMQAEEIRADEIQADAILADVIQADQTIARQIPLGSPLSTPAFQSGDVPPVLGQPDLRAPVVTGNQLAREFIQTPDERVDVWIADKTLTRTTSEMLTPFSVHENPLMLGESNNQAPLPVDDDVSTTLGKQPLEIEPPKDRTATLPFFLNVRSNSSTECTPEGCVLNSPEACLTNAEPCLDAPFEGLGISAPQVTYVPQQRPGDEYICDGGDAEGKVRVDETWQLRGLDLEDTIGHFDTLDGRTLVEPSNNVCIYAPRFAAVRKISGAFSDDQIIETIAANSPLVTGVEKQNDVFVAFDKHASAQHAHLVDGAFTFRDRTRGISLDRSLPVRELSDAFESFENLYVMRHGLFKQSEKAALATRNEAAMTWSQAEGPEVLIDDVKAFIDKISKRPGIIYHTDDSGNPRLRVVKIASTANAKPGEEVIFTLRFDNVGDQPIGNVTIIDNLTTRLEYVDDTAECDLKAEFFSDYNAGDSLTLRWEIDEPMKPGDGGVIRFRCKVK